MMDEDDDEGTTTGADRRVGTCNVMIMMRARRQQSKVLTQQPCTIVAFSLLHSRSAIVVRVVFQNSRNIRTTDRRTDRFDSLTGRRVCYRMA